MKANKTYINNRQARYNYFIEDVYRAGIVLKGSEVRSIREGHCNIRDAFCYFKDNEIFLKNSQISVLGHSFFAHEEIYDRKLLLSKTEINKLQKAIKVKGYTIIPLSVEIPNNGYIKVNIALCKGKHTYDKRNAIKEKDLSREKY